MARKRRAPPALTEDSSSGRVLEWFGSILPADELQKVLEDLKRTGETPDGQVLLNCTDGDLERGLGISSFTARKRILINLNQLQKPSGTNGIVKEEAVEMATGTQQASRPRRSIRGRRGQAALGAHMPLPSPPGAGPGLGVDDKDESMQQDGGEGAAGEEAEEGGAGGGQRQRRRRQLRVSSVTAAGAASGRSTPSHRGHRAASRASREPEEGEEAEQLQRSGRRGAFRASREPEGQAQQQQEDAEGMERGEAVARAPASGVCTRTRAARRQSLDAGSGGSGDGAGGRVVAGGVPGGGGRRWRPPAQSDIAVDKFVGCRRGLEEILKLKTLDELRELVEEPEHDLVDSILGRKVKREGEYVTVEYKRVDIVAQRMAKYIMDGTLDEKDKDTNGWKLDEIELFLRRHCDEQVKKYVADHLAYQFAAIPQGIRDEHELMWKLWTVPVGCPAGPRGQPHQELLGTITYEIQVMEPQCNLDRVRLDDDGTLPFSRLYDAIEAKELRLKGYGEDDKNLFAIINILSYAARFKARAKLNTFKVNRSQARTCVLYIYQTFAKSSSLSVLSACWEGKTSEGGDEVFSVDLTPMLCALDHIKGTEAEAQLNRLSDKYDQATEQALNAGLDDRQSYHSPLDLKQFDTIMGLVEDFDRPEPEELEEQCREEIKLHLKPYQRRSIAFMLAEEQVQGGSARNLWVKLDLPSNPKLTCYASPILHQIVTGTSKIEVEQLVGACGGSGWIALEMGMGKTACAIATILLNPPPEDWRRDRGGWKEPYEEDYLGSVKDNMPHGGTLIVSPSTLLVQWEEEFAKTAREELRLLDWGDRTGKRDLRLEDCREIAQYDVVFTTPALATTKHLLSNIFWHRIIVDEPQLQMGGFLSDKSHSWMANHRWLLTGTPCNSSVDTISPSLDFLRLGGGYTEAYKYLSPVMTAVLQAAMVRYTKAGTINGMTNLELPAVTERVVECELDERYDNDDEDFIDDEGDERRDSDTKFYDEEEVKARNIMNSVLFKHHVDVVNGRNEDDYEYKKGLLPMFRLRKLIDPVRRSAAGAFKHETGRLIERGDRLVKEKVLTHSKADALIADLARLKEREPESKVLIFSEWPDALRQVQRRLKDIGLQHRSILGGGGSQARGRAIKLFQADPPTKVFLITHRVGGAGITLTSASHVYLMEPCLNLSFEKQAIGRTVRIGQHKPVTVTRLVMKGTIEERLVQVLARKRAHTPEGAASAEAEAEVEVFHSTAAELNPAANDDTSKLTVEDLHELLAKSGGEEGEEEQEEGAGGGAEG